MTYPIIKLREQRWRVDGKGRMLHKGSNRLLALQQRGGGRVEMRLFREADREVLLLDVLPGVDISGEVYTPDAVHFMNCHISYIFSVLEVPMFGSNKDC